MKVVKKIKEKINSTYKKQQKKIDKIDTQRREEKIKEEQLKELHSEEFKKISTFIEEYDQRKCLDKEKELLELINKKIKEYEFELKNTPFISYYENQTEKNKIKIIEEFINSLTEEEINSNIYLKTAYYLLELSKKDCQTIVEKAMKKISHDTYIPYPKINKIYQITIPIESENIGIFFKEVKTGKYIYYSSTDESKELKIVYIQVLDEENIKIYEKYNGIVRSMHRLAIAIYRLRIAEIISNYEIDESHNIIISDYIGTIFAQSVLIDTESWNNTIYANISMNLNLIENKQEEKNPKQNNKPKTKVLKKLPFNIYYD